MPDTPCSGKRPVFHAKFPMRDTGSYTLYGLSLPAHRRATRTVFLSAAPLSRQFPSLRFYIYSPSSTDISEEPPLVPSMGSGLPPQPVNAIAASPAARHTANFFLNMISSLSFTFLYYTFHLVCLSIYSSSL